jgi:hypothetical protein
LAEVYGYIEEVGGKGKKYVDESSPRFFVYPPSFTKFPNSVLSSFRTLNFEDFKNMLERMKNGQLSATTGVPSLIKEGSVLRFWQLLWSICEYYI